MLLLNCIVLAHLRMGTKIFVIAVGTFVWTPKYSYAHISLTYGHYYSYAVVALTYWHQNIRYFYY